jgi:hypothetical protein
MQISGPISMLVIILLGKKRILKEMHFPTRLIDSISVIYVLTNVIFFQK